MFERSHSLKIPGAEKNDLKKDLYECNEVIDNLKKELNAEREASATSTRETMSMILRLQREKAELVMEAEQQKRIINEEMTHAKTMRALLDNLVDQRGKENTALMSLVEAYRSQLLSLGFSDFTSLDVKLQEKDDKDENHLSFISDRSQTPLPEFDDDLSIPEEKEVIEQSLGSGRHEERTSLDVYREKIKKLEEQVKELKVLTDSMQYKNSFSESGFNEGEEDFATSSKFQEDTHGKEEAKVLCIPDHPLAIKVSKPADMVTNPSEQASGKRNLTEHQAELQWLRQRIEWIERGGTKREPITSQVLKQEEISLVIDNKEEISSGQLPEMKSLNTVENLQPWINPAIVSLQEAMLYFWL